MDNAERFEVEVVYALASEQDIALLTVGQGCSVRDAIELSGLLERHGINPDGLKVGIFGEHRQMSDSLRAGDRVEIYRDLVDDPKVIRRRRAANRA